MELLKSYSIRQLVKNCPRKLYFRYVAGIKAKDRVNDARVIGKLFHFGLEGLRQNLTTIDVINQIKSVLDEKNFDEQQKQVELIKVSAYLEGYRNTYHWDWDTPGDLHCEVKLSFEDDVCIMDCIKDTNEGSIIIIEDKTAASFSQDLQSALVLNEQLYNYMYMCEALDVEIKEIRYRETKKSLHRLNAKESITDFEERIKNLYVTGSDHYREFVFEPSQREMDSFKIDRMALNEYIDSLLYVYADRQHWEWPKNSASCIGGFGPCEFLGICSGCRTNLIDFYFQNGKDPIDKGEFRHKYSIGIE